MGPGSSKIEDYIYSRKINTIGGSSKETYKPAITIALLSWAPHLMTRAGIIIVFYTRVWDKVFIGTCCPTAVEFMS